ncbi:MAG: 30S ribosomal protein S8 [Gammaproteobacteria bacterium]|nr:30S ribosomal protein S8 [Gammaproteobacteria bacterium]
MSMTDPVADMLTRIRNGLMAEKKSVSMPGSKYKYAISKVLLDEGYISSTELKSEDNGKSTLVIDLKYFSGKPVIEMINKGSRPGLRLYKGSSEIPDVWGGLGTVIMSTSKGVMTDKQARAINEGGEVICYIA